MKDPQLIPAAAFEAGTVNQPNRARQYQAAQHKTPEKLLEGVNAAGAIARGARADLDRLQHRMNLQLRNSIIVALLTGAMMRGPDLWHWLSALLK